jgi:hypothetical protein
MESAIYEAPLYVAFSNHFLLLPELQTFSSVLFVTHALSMLWDQVLHSHKTAGNIVILHILIISFFLKGSRDSDWLGAWRPRGRSSSPARVKNFLFFTSSRPALGSTQPPTQWVPGAICSGVKRPWREADYSPTTSAEVKNTWLYICTPPYAFMA